MKNKQAFTLSRHAESALLPLRAALKGCYSGSNKTISASSRYQNNKTLKQVQGDGRKGFSLIELLVVVLIIGILAAVALPQYKIAVAKSRFAAIIPVVEALKRAEELYYTANGEYTSVVENLDIGVSSNCKIVLDTSVFACGNDWRIDVINGNGELASQLFVTAVYCPNGDPAASGYYCGGGAEYIYYVYLAHSDKPNERTCKGITPFGQKFCKTLS